jgi:hypothetical protein
LTKFVLNNNFCKRTHENIVILNLKSYQGEQTEEMCMNSIRHNISNFKYVKNKTDKLCLEVVKQNGIFLQYIENQIDEICIEAVKKMEIY